MSANQILLFKKSKTDYTDSDVVATASQGSIYAPLALNRSNTSGWITTGSVDADNTTFTVDMVNSHIVDQILLVGHNFKAFTVKYWDGAAYQAFSPAINETTNTATTNRFSVTSVETTKLQVRITGTQVVNSDKRLAQFIATELIGRLNAWPIIENAVFDRYKRVTKMLSGKSLIAENIGGFSCDLSVTIWSNNADLTIVESLYNSNNGFLVWLCGGDTSQFSSVRQGYRLEDVFLMKCTNDFQPNWVEGLYKSGLGLQISLSEVTT